MESTYAPEIDPAGPEQPESAPPPFIVLEPADDSAACTVDGECL